MPIPTCLAKVKTAWLFMYESTPTEAQKCWGGHRGRTDCNPNVRKAAFGVAVSIDIQLEQLSAYTTSSGKSIPFPVFTWDFARVYILMITSQHESLLLLNSFYFIIIESTTDVPYFPPPPSPGPTPGLPPTTVCVHVLCIYNNESVMC